ncbi:MAG: AEC family transporter [Rhodospirillaceae bacterium]|nr:AEC family transporter [Rhodospirillaceae bacterium]MBT6202985.1 AEC family transporter [Rhodospirillaceae bacterium]MBT6512866.1 AEC family transporter [Rhodospirillaceae bacterium]
MALISALVPVLAPIAIAILVGVAWAKWGKPADPASLTQVILNVGTPCLVFSTLSTLSVPALELGVMAFAAVLMLLSFLATGWVLLKVAGLPSGVYLPPVVFGNLGNLGLPLNLFAFGDAGLELGLIMFATQSVLFFTIHFWLMSGSPSPMMMLKTPHIYAITVALAFTLTNTDPPLWLTNTSDLIGGLTIPLMLILLGVSLTRMKVVAFARPLVVVVLRLLLGFAVAVMLCELLNLEGTASGVVTIACCMPGAVFNYLASVKFDRSPGEVASYIVLSTVVMLVLLPVLVPLSWWMAGQ